MSYQKQSLFNRCVIEGITTIISEKHFRQSENINSLYSFIDSLASLFGPYFFAYYLITFYIHKTIPKYRKKIADTKNFVRKLISDLQNIKN